MQMIMMSTIWLRVCLFAAVLVDGLTTRRAPTVHCVISSASMVSTDAPSVTQDDLSSQGSRQLSATQPLPVSLLSLRPEELVSFLGGRYAAVFF